MSAESPASSERPTRSEILRRAPVDIAGGTSPSIWEFVTATSIVDAAGVVPPVSQHVDSPVGRPRVLTVRALLVASMINGLRRHHVGHLTSVVRILNSLDVRQREDLDIAGWTSDAASYLRTERLFVSLAAALDAGHHIVEDDRAVPLDSTWFANRIIAASCPRELTLTRSVAIDGTDVATWGQLHGDVDTVEIDPEEDADERDPDEAETRLLPPGRRRYKARVLGIGHDGRKVYTKDETARAGHRSATASRPSGPYIGRELHLMTQARDDHQSRGKKGGRTGERVPGLIRGMALTPAGTHRGRTATALLVDANRRGYAIADVIVDGGYSLSRPEYFHAPLRAAGIGITFRPGSHQWRVKPFNDHAILIGGQLFSATVPKEVLSLRPPAMDATTAERKTIAEAFDGRAQYAYHPHGGADRDGYTRWRNPVDAGTLRSRDMPESLRAHPEAPLVNLPGGVPPRTMTVAAVDLPLMQRLIAGTTTHNTSMARRNVVENSNNRLQGDYVDLDRGFVRLFGTTKITMMIAFAVAGLNVLIAKQWRSRQERIHASNRGPRRRRRRRDGGDGTVQLPVTDGVTARAPP